MTEIKTSGFTFKELRDSGLSEEDIQQYFDGVDAAASLSQKTGLTYEQATSALNSWSYELPDTPEGQWKHALTESHNEYIRRGEAFDQNVDLDELR